MKITQETENRLFNRKELELETSYKGSTPNGAEIKKQVSELTKSKEEVIIIEKIDQAYGDAKAKIKVKIYTSSEDLKKAEVINKKPKKKVGEKKS